MEVVGDAFDRSRRRHSGSPGGGGGYSGQGWQDLVGGQHGHNAHQHHENGDGLNDVVPPPPQEVPSARRDLSFYDESPPSSLRKKKKKKKEKSKKKHKGTTMTTVAKESSGSGIGGYKWSGERFIAGRLVMRATDEVKADSWDGATTPARLRVSAVSASDPTMLASSSTSGASGSAGGSGISNPQQRITPSYVEACTAGVEDEMKVMVEQMLMDAEQRRQKRAEKQAAKERERSKNRERKDGKDKIKDKDKEKKEQRVKRSASAFGLFGPGGARRKRKEEKEKEKELQQAMQHSSEGGSGSSVEQSTPSKEERTKDVPKEKNSQKHGSLPAKVSVAELKHSSESKSGLGAALRAIVSTDKLEKERGESEPSSSSEPPKTKSHKSSRKKAYLAPCSSFNSWVLLACTDKCPAGMLTRVLDRVLVHHQRHRPPAFSGSVPGLWILVLPCTTLQPLS